MSRTWTPIARAREGTAVTDREKRAGRPAGDRPQRRDGAATRGSRGQGSRTGASSRGSAPRGAAASDRPARPAKEPGGDRRPRRPEPPLRDEVTATDLDRAVRAELSSLAKLNAETVARHLVMAGLLLDDDPETANAHADLARERAGRVGAVREPVGLAAYRTGRYAEALAELRAARRIGGDQSLLPVMADCERGLGRPEKALELAASPQAATLDAAGRAEMLIVASGARRDLGQPEAAALLLQGPELRPDAPRAWSARLFYAYAEALLASGRVLEATEWFSHAMAADVEGETDAGDRWDELTGVSFSERADDEAGTGPDDDVHTSAPWAGRPQPDA